MTVYIMRGVSGSGKSTLAAKIAAITGAAIASADDYFRLPARGGRDRDVQGARWDYEKNAPAQPGPYDFNPAELGFAHAFCMREFLDGLRWGSVVVDNTNTTAIEIAPYLLAAQAARQEVYIVHVRCEAHTASVRNTHGVPSHAIQAMADRLEVALPGFWPREVAVYGDFPLDVFATLADVPAEGGMSIQQSVGAVTSLVYDPAPYAGYEDEEGQWIYTRQAICLG